MPADKAPAGNDAARSGGLAEEDGWAAFIARAGEEAAARNLSLNGLGHLHGGFRDGELTLLCPHRFVFDQYSGDANKLAALENAARDIYGPDVRVRVAPPADGAPSLEEARRIIKEDPLVSRFENFFGARMLEFGPRGITGLDGAAVDE